MARYATIHEPGKLTAGYTTRPNTAVVDGGGSGERSVGTASGGGEVTPLDGTLPKEFGQRVSAASGR